MIQEQRQNYEKIYKLVIDLQKKHWPYEGEKDKSQALNQVINFAQILGITIEPTDPNFLPTVAKKILEELIKPLEQEAPSIPPDLEGFVKAMDEARIREEARRENLMTEGPRKTYNYFLNLNKKIITQNYPQLSEGAVNKVSREITEDIINRIPAVARPDLLKATSEDYQQAIDKNLIAEKLKNAGLEPKENISQELLKNPNVVRVVKEIAAEPEIIKPVKEEALKLEKPSDKIPPLPKEILDQINQPQEALTFTTAYLLHPKVAAASLKKLVSAPQAALIKNAIENASLDWQGDKKWPIVKEITNNRIFTEDVQATINFLKEKGLPENHPLIQKLQDKLFYFQAVQINPKTGKDFPWVTVLKRNSYLDELLGRKRVPDDYLGYLPCVANETIWRQKGSYGYYLQQGLDKFRFISNTSQRFISFITRGKYKSVGIFIRKAVYQKAIKPILIKLGKTAAGKAIKEGTKKVSTWLAVKLGIQLGTKAAAAAAAPETAGISLLISFAIDAAMFLVNMIRKGFSLIRRGWHQLSEDPEKATVSLILGGTLLIIPALISVGPILIPILTIIGAPLAIAGGVSLLAVGFKAASVGSAATTLSVQTAATTATIGGNVVLGSVVGVGVGALIITQITASAFLIPESEQFAGSPYIQLSKTGDFIGNEETGIGEIIYQINVGAQDEALTEVKISDQLSTRCLNDQLKINSEPLESPPEIINSGDSWETSYNVKTEGSFKDCLIINKITVLAKVESQPDEVQEKSSTYVIQIGNPPDDCPYGWPTSGVITSLPGEPRVGHTHAGIDIANVKGTPIYSTHGGSASYGEGGAKGKYVEIVGSCNGQVFQTVYYHLSAIKINSVDISSCSEIGLMGNTGNSYGPNGGYHLHYEIRQLGSDWWTSEEYLPRPQKGDQVTNSCF